MRRIDGVVELLHVAELTFFASSGIAAGCVAFLAGGKSMPSGQWKVSLVVIDYRRFPGRGGMANLASFVEAFHPMIGIVSRFEVGSVTGQALCGKIGKLTAGMA